MDLSENPVPMVLKFDGSSLYLPYEIPNFQKHRNLPCNVTTLVFRKKNNLSVALFQLNQLSCFIQVYSLYTHLTILSSQMVHYYSGK